MEKEYKCFHLYSDGSSTPTLHESNELFIHTMNQLPLFSLICGCNILAFALMTTHFHVILRGEARNCRDFADNILMSLSRKNLAGKDEKLHLALDCLTEETEILRKICYVLRNPLDMSHRLAPQYYRWSCYYLYFACPVQPGSYLNSSDYAALDFHSSERGLSHGIPDVASSGQSVLTDLSIALDPFMYPSLEPCPSYSTIIRSFSSRQSAVSSVSTKPTFLRETSSQPSAYNSPATSSSPMHSLSEQKLSSKPFADVRQPANCRSTVEQPFVAHSGTALQVGEISNRALFSILKTRYKDFPKDWTISPHGYILPCNYVDYRYVESLYGTVRRFISFFNISKAESEKMKRSLNSFVISSYDDNYIRAQANSESRRRFGRTVRFLMNSELLTIADYLSKTFYARPKQIRRILRINEKVYQPDI